VKNGEKGGPLGKRRTQSPPAEPAVGRGLTNAMLDDADFFVEKIEGGKVMSRKNPKPVPGTRVVAVLERLTPVQDSGSPGRDSAVRDGRAIRIPRDPFRPAWRPAAPPD